MTIVESVVEPCWSRHLGRRRSLEEQEQDQELQALDGSGQG